LTSEQLLAFGRLYRRAVGSLSLAKSEGIDESTIDYLNSLVGRAYGRIYRSESRGIRSIPRFFARELPVTFRRSGRYIALGFGIFLLGAMVGFAVTAIRPGLADVVLGPSWADRMDDYAEQFRGEVNIIPEELRPVFSSVIVTNNIQVAVVAFATGIFFGLGTIYALFANGLMMGMVSGGVQVRGVSGNFWGFVAPHGVIELTAVFMAAGAGLMLGLALLSPGDLPRKVALKSAAREAFKLVLGAASLLAVAAVIEAFFSPTATPNQLKFAFAACMAFLLITYFGFAGSTPETERA